MAILAINDIKAWRSPTDINITLDDRQTLIETLNGNITQDFGYHSSGDKIEFSCTFKRSDFLKIFDLFKTRQFVTITDTGGNIWNNCRILIKSYGYLENFQDYINTRIEVWRI